MNWGSHSVKIANKICLTLGVMNCLKRYLPLSALKIMYDSLILSRIQFGIACWGFEWGRLAKLQKEQFVSLQTVNLNWHQTILHTFLNLFLNLTLPGMPHLYKQLPNGQYLSDLCKMCNLEANLWKNWIGDHRILTYIFKWEGLNTAGHSHSVSICHWVAPLHND